MIHIDGSTGEGGGQMLRSALSLSLVTGKGFRMENIRAKREKSGLLRQHLTAVLAACEIASAQVEGATLGSKTLTFTPGSVRSGNYRFAVGTAGSGTLVFQTILPALMTASGRSEITIEGGTHNMQAPPLDFLQKAFLPVVSRASVQRSRFVLKSTGSIRLAVAVLSPRLNRANGSLRFSWWKGERLNAEARWQLWRICRETLHSVRSIQSRNC